MLREECTDAARRYLHQINVCKEKKNGNGTKPAFHDVINDIIQDVLSHASAHTRTYIYTHLTLLVYRHKT